MIANYCRGVIAAGAAGRGCEKAAPESRPPKTHTNRVRERNFFMGNLSLQGENAGENVSKG
jgi:hypothetical protein